LTPEDGRSRGNFSANLERGQRRGLTLRLRATRGYIESDARYPPSLYARSAREFFRLPPPKINRDARPSRIIVEYHGTDVTKANPLVVETQFSRIPDIPVTRSPRYPRLEPRHVPRGRLR